MNVYGLPSVRAFSMHRSQVQSWNAGGTWLLNEETIPPTTPRACFLMGMMLLSQCLWLCLRIVSGALLLLLLLLWLLI